MAAAGHVALGHENIGMCSSFVPAISEKAADLTAIAGSDAVNPSATAGGRPHIVPLSLFAVFPKVSVNFAFGIEQAMWRWSVLSAR